MNQKNDTDEVLPANVKLTVTVWDEDWETEEWEDIKDCIADETGRLSIIGHDMLIMAMYAPGAWKKVEYDLSERTE